jgi:hypothetical protein
MRKKNNCAKEDLGWPNDRRKFDRQKFDRQKSDHHKFDRHILIDCTEDIEMVQL